MINFGSAKRWTMVAATIMAGGGLGACTTDSSTHDPSVDAVVNQLQGELNAWSEKNPSERQLRNVKPVLACVEKVSATQFKAHFGYKNGNSTSVKIPVGFNNRFWPSPINAGQPTTFLPGTHADVVQVLFNELTPSIWLLGTNLDYATKFSPRCRTGSGSGGSPGTGGTVASGGSCSTGGSVASGGVVGTGGVVASGGVVGTGGIVASGGVVGTGGIVASGGVVGTGGIVASGGVVGTGGIVASGGVVGTGGIVASGGVVGTGGIVASGGVVGTGGVEASGGVVGTGGVEASGGVVGTGGVTPPACPASCDDSNPCTTDDCSAATGFACTHVEITCTASDQCHAAGTCNPSTGLCSNPAKADGASCTDGNACTTGDVCLSGICTMGNPTVCGAPDQCHAAGVCDANTGACSNPTAPNGTACNDGNACTTADVCTAGVCGGTAKTCAASDQCHASGICDSTTGNCSNPPVTDGTACNDGSACSTADVCTAGVCGGTAKTCAPADQCHVAGLCDATTGTCSSPNAPDGTACTSSGTAGKCTAGACVVSNVCTDPTHCSPVCDQCQVDNCSPSTDGCDTLTDPAAKSLCQQLYACFTNPANNCLLPGNQGDAIPCWCGTNPTTCVSANSGPTKANGPCLDLVTQGAGLTAATYDAATIKARLINPNFPLGRAINLTSCEGQFCNAECTIP